MCGGCEPQKAPVVVVRKPEPIEKVGAPAVERPSSEPVSITKAEPVNCEHKHAFCSPNTVDVTRTLQSHKMVERKVLTTKFVMKTVKRRVTQTVLKRKPRTEYTIYKTDREITEQQEMKQEGETDFSKILKIDVTCMLPAEESKPVQVDDYVLVD